MNNWCEIKFFHVKCIREEPSGTGQRDPVAVLEKAKTASSSRTREHTQVKIGQAQVRALLSLSLSPISCQLHYTCIYFLIVILHDIQTTTC